MTSAVITLTTHTGDVARRAMARTLRRVAHGAIDGNGLPTCRRDVCGATASYAGVLRAGVIGAAAAFPTAGGDGWTFVPDTTPARRA